MSSACSADEPAAFRSIGQPLTEAEVHAAGLVPEDWIGDALGVGIDSWTYLGPVEWVPADQADETYAQTMATAATVEGTAPSEPGSLGTATRRFIYIDMIEGEAYRVEFPTAALDAIAAAVEDDAAALDDVPCFTNTDSNNIVIEDSLATVRAHDCDTSPGHSGGRSTTSEAAWCRRSPASTSAATTGPASSTSSDE